MSATRNTPSVRIEHVIAAYVDTARGALTRAAARSPEIESESTRGLTLATLEIVGRVLGLVSALLRAGLAHDRNQDRGGAVRVGRTLHD